MGSRKGIAFISSPYKSDNDLNIIHNVKIARAMCKLAIDQGYAPFASHLIYTQFLDESVPEQREMGIEYGREFLEYADIIYIYKGEGSKESEGMKGDLESSMIEIRLVTNKDLELYMKDSFIPPWVKE